jgi:hypothetical protein
MPAMDRRRFFETLGVAWLARPPLYGDSAALLRFRAAAQARDLVRSGAIGRVAFCRAADRGWLRLANEICGENGLIAEVDPVGAPGGAVILGSAATLVLDTDEGCRLLP